MELKIGGTVGSLLMAVQCLLLRLLVFQHVCDCEGFCTLILLLCASVDACRHSCSECRLYCSLCSCTTLLTDERIDSIYVVESSDLIP